MASNNNVSMSDLFGVSAAPIAPDGKTSKYDNVDVKFEGTKVVITVELDPTKVQYETSASGKTKTAATTGGYKWFFDGALGINLTVSVK